MVRYIFFLLLSFIQLDSVSAQPRGFSFTLEGSLNSDTGTAQLFPMGNPLYYAYHPESIKVPVVRGKFVFKDSVLYPSAYRIFFFRGNELTYLSDFFLIDSGYQTLRCNIDSLREMPFLANNSRGESDNYYDHVLSRLNLASAELSENENQLSYQYGKNLPDSLRIRDLIEYELLAYNKSKVLLNYAKEHPSSWVALWDLIHRFQSGYKGIYDSVYAQFSDDIKDSYTGKILAAKLYGARVTATGSTFPRLPLLTTTNKPVSVPGTSAHDKYVLIDFWYSHCGPCISQFQDLKNIYAFYRPKGFDILGISVDKKNLVEDWKAAIQQYELPWKQYLDLEGKEADKLSIEETPTNFLLDANGKIIARDMDPTALKLFLKNNLL